MEQVAALVYAHDNALVNGGGFIDHAIADGAFAALAAWEALQETAALALYQVMAPVRGNDQPVFAGGSLLMGAAQFAARHAVRACTRRATRCDAVGCE